MPRPSRNAGPDEPARTEGSLARGLAVLTALSQFPDGGGASEVSRMVKLPLSSTHRLLATLVASGFAEQNATTKLYVLSPRLLEIARRATDNLPLAQVALQPMRQLALATGETVLLAKRTGLRMVFIQRAISGETVSVQGNIGQESPMHCTSTGKAVLAALSEPEAQAIVSQLPLDRYTENTLTTPSALLEDLTVTRLRGYARVDEEYEHGVVAIGVPVTTPGEFGETALCVCAPNFGDRGVGILSHLDTLRRTADAIRTLLGVSAR